MLECGGNEQQLIEIKVQAFLKSRKNANSLVDIVSILEDKKDNFKKCILALETIFVEVLTRKEMYDDKKGNRTSSEAKYRMWLREMYETTFSKLVSILEDGKSVSQQQAFDTVMKLLELEGKNPLEPSKYEGYQFPSHRLQQIVKGLLSSTRSMKIQIAKFSEFVQYQDIVYFTWKLLQSNTVVVSKPNETCITNFLDLVDKTIVKQEDSSLVLCSIDDGPEFSMQQDHVSKWIAKTWLYVMKWEHTAATHKQLMVVLLEKVLPHIKKPLYLTDYLMTTLGMGGALSVLALQGLLTLIQNYNLDYPNIYGKLYTMIDADIFHMKYKPRLFYLSDMFLTSSHLPQQLVAAFAKRLSRLTLIAPPQDIQIMLAFIGNLLIRHPGLKRLLVGSVTDPEVASDPFDENEPDPMKSRAIDSFLWEVYNLQRHYLPSIANVATQLVNAPLPSVEWDLGQFLENTQDDIFDKELKKKAEELTLTYDKPQSLRLPQGERLLHYWTLT